MPHAGAFDRLHIPCKAVTACAGARQQSITDQTPAMLRGAPLRLAAIRRNGTPKVATADLWRVLRYRAHTAGP